MDAHVREVEMYTHFGAISQSAPLPRAIFEARTFVTNPNPLSSLLTTDTSNHSQVSLPLLTKAVWVTSVWQSVPL